MLERLSVDYGKKVKMTLTVIPSRSLGTSALEPYNSVLSTHVLTEHADLTLGFDNESLYDICRRNLLVDAPFYSDINALVAQACGDLNSPRNSLRNATHFYIFLVFFVVFLFFRLFG